LIENYFWYLLYYTKQYERVNCFFKGSRSKKMAIPGIGAGMAIGRGRCKMDKNYIRGPVSSSSICLFVWDSAIEMEAA
jgi:hypothetical protein